MTATANQPQPRRVAVNTLLTPHGEAIEPAWIVIEDGIATAYGPLTEELPMTQWLGGTARIDTTRHVSFGQ